MTYRAIQPHDRREPIRLMCRAPAVSAMGYYAWRGRPESRWAAANRTLLATIRALHHDSCSRYGSPGIWRALRKQGHRVGEHRVAQLRRHNGLRAKTVKNWRATTHSSHRLPVVAKTLQRHFTVTQPKRVSADDITYVWTLEGGLYLVVLLDLYSRAVIGWAMGPRLSGDLTGQAFHMDGAHHSAAHSGTPTSLRSREPVGRRTVPAAAHHARHTASMRRTANC